MYTLLGHMPYSIKIPSDDITIIRNYRNYWMGANALLVDDNCENVASCSVGYVETIDDEMDTIRVLSFPQYKILLAIPTFMNVRHWVSILLRKNDIYYFYEQLQYGQCLDCI